MKTKDGNPIYSRHNTPPKVVLDCGPGLTKQHMKDECDINKIIARYEKTGLLTHMRQIEPQYLDTTGIDYEAALNVVAQTNSIFESLPAQLRNKFENDPTQFLDYMHNPDNYSEAVELGLMHPSVLEVVEDLSGVADPAQGGAPAGPATQGGVEGEAPSAT